MSDENRDPILEMFIFETNQLLEQLEDIMLTVEQEGDISTDNINEIFRAMHTIKGSAAMMSYDNISTVAHRIEDLFFKIRENNAVSEEEFSRVCDIVFEGKDFIKEQMELVEAGEEVTETADELIGRINDLLAEMNGEAPAKKEEKKEEKAEETVKISDIPEGEQLYIVNVKFEADCKMENVRAFSVVNEMEKHAENIITTPAELFEDPNASDTIAQDGLGLQFTSALSKAELEKILKAQICVDTITFKDAAAPAPEEKKAEAEEPAKTEDTAAKPVAAKPAKKAPAKKPSAKPAAKQSLINVSVDKLDALLDFVGEIVIAQSMVVQNPELAGLNLTNFYKASEHLQKLTKELQDVVMAIRMIPIASAFHKMNRIVRDMSKSLNKDVELVISGEETEVDKTIIDSLSDPLMHLVRNCMDHGLETTEERLQKGKPQKGKVMLRAYNNGNNVVVTVADDGKGLDRTKIFNKAVERGLLSADDTVTDKQIYECILLPGFSTKEQVTEFSGRGVGMDVVKSNIESIGGSILLDSKPNEGTTFTIKIPLTLAIIDGMSVAVGDMSIIIPMVSVQEAIRCKAEDVVKDPYGKERLLIRGKYCDVIRLHEKYGIEVEDDDISKAILISVESKRGNIYLAVDAILGEQQIVIKPLPKYLQKNLEPDCAFSGCTILGDGNVGFIINTNEL